MEITRQKPTLSDEDREQGLSEFKSQRVTKEVEPPIKPGWSRQQRPRSANAVQVPRFAVPDDGEEVLIKFLDEMPFAPIYQHWIATDSGRRAYTCAGFNDCPLCARGDKAKASDWFNIVVLGETPELKVWIASPDPSAAIEERATGKRTSPINREGLYFAVSKRKGSNGFFSYSVDPVRGDELEADWGVQPLNEAALKKFNSEKFDSSAVRIHTVAELTEASRHLVTD
jgi:hypothetical protein